MRCTRLRRPHGLQLPDCALCAVQRQFNFFKKLGCAECGAEAGAAVEILDCCMELLTEEDCTGSCMPDPRVANGTAVVSGAAPILTPPPPHPPRGS